MSYTKIAGQVIEIQSDTEATVTGNAYGVRSQNTHHVRYYLRCQDDKERWFSLVNQDLPIRRGHHVTAIFRDDHAIAICIHELGQLTSVKDARFFIREAKGGCGFFALFLLTLPLVWAGGTVVLQGLGEIGSIPEFYPEEKDFSDPINYRKILPITLSTLVWLLLPLVISWWQSVSYRRKIKKLDQEIGDNVQRLLHEQDRPGSVGENIVDFPKLPPKLPSA